MASERADGFYWVRAGGLADWEIAKLQHGLWRLIGGEEEFNARAFTEIGPQVKREASEDTVRLEFCAAHCFPIETISQGWVLICRCGLKGVGATPSEAIDAARGVSK